MTQQVSDTIMEAESPVTMLAQTDTMSTWSDQKKAEFSDLFSRRTKIARILCELTVSKLANMAKRRHFISDYHLTKLKRSHSWSPVQEYKYRYECDIRECGRDPEEVIRIAEQRAKALLSELPPLKKAVQVIDAETAKKLTRMEKLQKKAEADKEALEELPRQIDMDDEPETMTLKEFKAKVSNLYEQRKKLMRAINKAGQEARDLEIAVSKKLYKGLPGLSEAVVDVIKAHLERGTALDQMQRRVTEQVKFGDSDAATGLLAQFEKDEANVSDELRGKLNAAMASLKASVKALPKKKRTKKAVAAGKGK
jgi:hypothetical protein